MADYNYVAEGGITTGGEAELTSNYWTALIESGLILMGGEANIVSSIWHYESSGGITMGGSADSSITRYDYLALPSSTSPKLGGSALALYGINLSTTGSGTITMGGSAPVVFALRVDGDGGIIIDGESPTILNADYVLDVEWDVRTYFDLAHNFTWDVGELPFKVYQVEGCCKPNDGTFGGCEVLPIDTNDPLNCDQRFLQTIFARNLQEVCEFLTNTNWKWPICSIKKFSTEAADLIYDGINKPPECNTLDEVEYCQIPECFEFCLQSDTSSHMGMFASVIENVFQVIGSGGITMGGVVDTVRRVEPSGGIVVSGEADVVAKLSEYHTEGDGGIVVAGDSEFASSYHQTEAAGEIVVAGEANIVSSNWKYTGSGGMTIAGEAGVVFRHVYVSTGKSDVYPTYAGIRMSGFAGYPILARTSGGITIFGSAKASVINYIEEGSGGIVMGGESSVVSPDWHYEGSGGIVMGGEVGYNYLSLAYNVDDSVPITLGGDADYRNSIDGDFWYTSLTDTPIAMGGDADCRISQLKYKPSSSPNILVTGQAGVTSTFRVVADSDMGFSSSIEGLEMNYSLDGKVSPSIVAPTTTVNTSCGECNQVSLKLHFKHNLEFAGVLRDFMIRNGYELPDTMTLFFNKRSDSWQGSMHYLGTAADNLMNQESWRINVDWACTNKYADDDFSSSVWRFSLLITRKNINTGLDFDTRLLLLFPSEAICITADRDGLDFPFQFDTRRQTVNTRQNIVVDVINLYDNIGLFKTSYWNTNNLSLRISEDFIVDNLNKKDITFIVPEKQPQFSI